MVEYNNKGKIRYLEIKGHKSKNSALYIEFLESGILVSSMSFRSG